MTDDTTFFGSGIVKAHTEDGLGGRQPASTTEPPEVTEALHRLRGRRADAIVNASTARVVEETKGQNRRTRRNNLRLARLDVKARRKALAAADGVLVDGEPVT